MLGMLPAQMMTTAQSWTASAAVATLALVFTVASFWWIHVRRGSLLSATPYSYAGYFAPQEIIIVLPLMLHNTGPAPIIVQNFRVTLTGGNGSNYLLHWRAIQPGINPAGVGEGRVFPSPIAVNGRSTVEKFIEVGRKSIEVNMTEGPYDAHVEILMSHRQKWRTLTRFQLHTQLSTADPHRWLVRPNDPEWEE